MTPAQSHMVNCGAEICICGWAGILWSLEPHPFTRADPTEFGNVAGERQGLSVARCLLYLYWWLTLWHLAHPFIVADVFFFFFNKREKAVKESHMCQVTHWILSGQQLTQYLSSSLQSR